MIPGIPPPSLFPGVPSTCVRQTSDEIRRGSQEDKENTQEEKLRQQRLESDQICDWVSFIEYCYNLEELIIIPKQGSPRSVSILRLSDDSPTSTIFSMEIMKHFEVICYLSPTAWETCIQCFEKHLYFPINEINSQIIW